MKLSGRALLISLALFALTAPAATSDWKPYGNARFQYWIDIPPDFTGVKESENSDGGSSSSPDGRAELRVWGSYLTEGSFAAEVNWRVDQDHSNGWIIAFRKQKANWADGRGPKAIASSMSAPFLSATMQRRIFVSNTIKSTKRHSTRLFRGWSSHSEPADVEIVPCRPCLRPSRAGRTRQSHRRNKQLSQLPVHPSHLMEAD